MNRAPLLQLEGVVKRFGGVTALDGVDFHVEQGEIVGLIGPNGAGKTTVFNVISGFARPDAGRIAFSGRAVNGLPAHEVCRLGITRTFQLAKPFGRLTTLENVRIAAHRQQRGFDESERIARETLQLVGLAGREGRAAGSLSVNERKRLELARALATKPTLILLDEVMAGLNPREIEDLVALIRGIRESGITILLIEHMMRAVLALCERVVVLSYGRRIAEGKPPDVARDPAVVQAYLGVRAHAASH